MTQVRKILIADEDKDFRTTLAEQLSLHQEFAVLQTEKGANAILTSCGAEPPDLVIIDSGLADLDGREAVRTLRSRGFKNPIILLANQNSDAEVMAGLDAGANDIVAKPLRFSVLLARIRAHLRQSEAVEDEVLQIGPYQFRPPKKTLTKDAEQLRLTEKETEILHYLFRAGAEGVAREILLREVWGYNDNVTTHTLETHIYRLRQKIERDPANAELLLTEAGGYRLNP